MGEVTAPGWLAGSLAAAAGAAEAAATATGAGAAAGAAAKATGAGAVNFDTRTFRLSFSPYSRFTLSSARSFWFSSSASA